MGACALRVAGGSEEGQFFACPWTCHMWNMGLPADGLGGWGGALARGVQAQVQGPKQASAIDSQVAVKQ